MKKYSTFVLCGGGVKCIALLGCLQYLYDNNLHGNIEKYIGTSAGAMVGLFLAIGCTPVEIIVYLCSNNVTESLLPFDIISLISGNGALQYEKLEYHLKNILLKKIGKDNLTLKQLYNEYGKTLISCTYNLTKNKCEYISHETYPDLDCIFSIRMSSSIPIIFNECIYNGNIYIDGAIVDNFPISIISSNLENVFGCIISTSYTSSYNNKFINMLISLLTISSHYNIDKILNKYQLLCDIVHIKLQNISVLDLSQKNSNKLDLFSIGYNYSNNYFKQSTSV